MIRISLMFLFLIVAVSAKAQAPSEKNPSTVLVIHGGAGTLRKKNMKPKQERAYRRTMEQALKKGQRMLKHGASSLDVVEAVVTLLEDSPLFNAGRGSVYNHPGQHEMDAAIMSGQDRRAGAVAGIRKAKNPVQAARLVMDSTKHVLLSGVGADLFAIEMKLPQADSSWFSTDFRYRQWQKARAEERIELDHDSREGHIPYHEIYPEKFGTVGAVALDQFGNVAAATSTGGLTNKKYGRIGDSPLIGAGTWADNETAAFSCTGRGEYFIRSVAAHSMAMQIKYQGVSIDSAASTIIQYELAPIGGKGGVIGVDRQGNITMTFNTRGMYRGFVRNSEKPVVKIYTGE